MVHQIADGAPSLCEGHACEVLGIDAGPSIFNQSFFAHVSCFLVESGIANNPGGPLEFLAQPQTGHILGTLLVGLLSR